MAFIDFPKIMFSGTAFPRIPFSGSAETAETAENTENNKPPAIPFDALLLVSNEKRAEPVEEPTDLEHWQTKISEHYASVAPGISTKDAKEFLASLCFMATRANKKK